MLRSLVGSEMCIRDRTYNFGTGRITGLPTGWQDFPSVVDITNTQVLFYSYPIRITEDALGGNQTFENVGIPVVRIDFGTNFRSDNFSGGSTGWDLERVTGGVEINSGIYRGDVESVGYNGLTDLSGVTSFASAFPSSVAEADRTGYFLDSSADTVVASEFYTSGFDISSGAIRIGDPTTTSVMVGAYDLSLPRGHIIEDPDGTDFTQRSHLQFTGNLAVSDDETADRTIVNVTGGHTIEDSDGTDFTQRTNLQFTGDATVTDDETNDRTIVDFTGGHVIQGPDSMPLPQRGNLRFTGSVTAMDDETDNVTIVDFAGGSGLGVLTLNTMTGHT